MEKDRGEADVEIPVGLVHPALLEPYRPRFFLQDEVVTDCEITLDAQHRGIERIMEGIPVDKCNIITERICGICSCVHLWNSVRVVEEGLNIEVPERAQYMRVIVNELERLTSHLIFFGHALEIIGHETLAMRAFIAREPFMILLGELSGNRVHYACPIIGGIRPRCNPTEDMRKKALTMLKPAADYLKDYADRILQDAMIMSRIDGIGILTKEEAVKYHAVGPTARSSGVEKDYRKDITDFNHFDWDVIVLDEGDVKARVVQRVLECFEILKIVEQGFKNLPEGEIRNKDWKLGKMPVTTCYHEAPRGELYDSYALDDKGDVRHYKNRTPTLTNLGCMEVACLGEHLTDAVLTLASCDPCICCTNR
jgi:energy-converting hydrogenase B subunit N